MLNVITAQLSNKEWDEQGIIVDPINIDETLQVLLKNKNKTNTISIYDKTFNNKLPNKHIIPVNDHINKTGINPLIGRQKQLNIDFIDMTHVYNKQPEGVITHCYGKTLPLNNNNESHYMSLITILCKATGYTSINGFLVNIK